MLGRFINFIIVSLLVIGNTLQAQTIQGVIRDFDDDHLVEETKVTILGTDISTISGDDGRFSFDSGGNLQGILFFSNDSYKGLKQEFTITAENGNIGTIILYPMKANVTDEGSSFDISEIDSDNDSEDNTYSLLTAGRDLFANATAYSFGVARFKRRGYSGNHTTISLNGALMNNLNDGNVYWSVWGGLNDVFRERTDVANVGIGDITYGSLGGTSDIDLRSSSQRKQLKGSYAITNRSYANRLMLTYSTGMMNNGWAITASGSRRWANEGGGYVEGTFYDAYSYFLSVDKRLSKSHMLNLVVLGAPVKRAKRSSSTQEANDIAGSNFYNANWGYQAGKKRNARVVNAFQPITMLTHDWTLNSKTKISTSIATQFGKYGNSRLEWNDAPDPRPDYYKNLPSYQLTDEKRAQVYDYLKDNPEEMQLDWDKFYYTNFITDPTTINNVDGIEGNSVTGKNATYALAETHYDNQKISFQSHMNTQLSSRSNLNVGVYYRNEVVNNYQKLIDLLGADYYLDIDKFAKRDNAGKHDFFQSDLNHPNRLAKVGDKIRYNYDINTSKPGVWAQYDIKMNKLDFYFGADVNSTSFYRKGLMKNGKFPESSFGKSEVQSSLGYSAKTGISYKLNGRNYFTLNTTYGSSPVGGRYAYSSSRTRDNLIKKLDNEIVKSADISYIGRYTGFKVNATAYFTRFENQVYNRSLYLDDASNSAFVNYIMTGIDKVHKGVELSVEKEIGAGFSIKGVAALGDYRYKSRPQINITHDNSPLTDTINLVGYLNNYFVPNTPQIAYNATLSYRSSNYWWANVSFNYFDKMYLDFYPHRRTEDAVKNVDKLEEPEKWNSILAQEKLPANYTVDLFVGKSWRKKDLMIYLNVGVNNILDNTNFRTGGYEQTRFDTRNQDVGKFPPKYFYAYGTNYYISLTFKI